MTKKQWIIIGIIIFGFVGVLIAINSKVMPYYAFVHSTEQIKAPYSPNVLHDTGNTVNISSVDELYMGWQGLAGLSPLFLMVFVLPSITGGYFVRNLWNDKEIEEELKRKISAQKVTASGVTIEGLNAEEIEFTLKTDYLKLEREKKKLESDLKSFEKEKKQFEENKMEAEEAVKQMAGMKQDYANRLDKITRLEKANEKLEKRVFELEREIMELKSENLQLRKKILELESK